MNRLIRFYNQNKKKFWTIVAVIIFIFFLIRILNYVAKINNEKKSEEINLLNNTKSVFEPNKSVLSDEKIDRTVYLSQNELVSKFVEYCNNKEIQKAYDLLSSDCKNEIYPTIQDFKEKYLDAIFNVKRTFSIRNWSGSIYIVRFTEDILSTGKVREGSSVQDYIKIVTEENEEKLNVNGFLGKENIGAQFEQNGIAIDVIDKSCYMDYEIYNFEVENNSGYNIILDTLSNNNTMYLTDKNNVNHYAITNEITRDLLVVKDKYKNRISIKFDNPYIVGRGISKISFKNIAELYNNNIDGDFRKVISLEVGL